MRRRRDMRWVTRLLEGLRARLLLGAGIEAALEENRRAAERLDAALREVLRK